MYLLESIKYNNLLLQKNNWVLVYNFLQLINIQNFPLQNFQ